MRRVVLFGEDYGHEMTIGALVKRLAEEHNVEIEPDWRATKGGYSKVVNQLRIYINNVNQYRDPLPDLTIVATDANDKGLGARKRELQKIGQLNAPDRMIYAIPDPHIERWLLLDEAAVNSVLGINFEVTKQSGGRGLYKRLLVEAVQASGNTPALGGIEYAEEIIRKMNIRQASRADESFKQFVEALQSIFRSWRQS